jgi:hypothetical protein
LQYYRIILRCLAGVSQQNAAAGVSQQNAAAGVSQQNAADFKLRTKN